MSTLEALCGALTGTAKVSCIITEADAMFESVYFAVDTIWLCYAGSLVFFMQAGFAMLCAGSIREKNVINILLKNLMDACVGAIFYWGLGYAFAYGAGGPFIGTTEFFLATNKNNPDTSPFWFFQWAFAATAATIVAGTVAERCKLEAYFLYSTFLTGFVYPIISRSIWSAEGWASAFRVKNGAPFERLLGGGMIDFAGSGVVHLTGGTVALVAAIILGPRLGRFRDAEGNRHTSKPKEFEGHSVVLQVLGTFILWFGWYGFNCGSTLTVFSGGLIASGEPFKDYAFTAGLCAVNTTLGAASGAISAMVLRWLLSPNNVVDITAVTNGALSGLVAVTAGCAVIWPWAAVVIGLIGGLVYIGASNLLLKLEIDDAVDAIPVHMANGIWGCLAVGFFASGTLLNRQYGQDEYIGWFYEWSRGSGNANLLATQLIGIIWIIGWAGGLMGLFFFVIDKLGLFRVDELVEADGLDTSEHGGRAYSFADKSPDSSKAEKGGVTAEEP